MKNEFLCAPVPRPLFSPVPAYWNLQVKVTETVWFLPSFFYDRVIYNRVTLSVLDFNLPLIMLYLSIFQHRKNCSFDSSIRALGI